MPCTDTYFLKVGARVSLKVANKGSIRGKKKLRKLRFLGSFLKPKRRSARKKFKTFLINLASLYLLHIHIFWK